jgi:drug/metabolite transporter (DMT)-like permease
MSTPLALVTVILSGVVYHLAQKTAGGGLPWPMLSIAYGAAFLASALLAVFTGGDGRGLLGQGITGLLVGLGAFGVEAGFFFVYRSGWPLSTTSLVSSLSIAVLLALLGVVAFGEPMSSSRAVGLALALGGVVLMARS